MKAGGGTRDSDSKPGKGDGARMKVHRGRLAGIEGVEADAARVLIQVLEPSLDKSSRRTELGVVALVPLSPFLSLRLLLGS